MVAYTIAALWPSSLAWQIPPLAYVSSTRPLLIHHSNAWLIKLLNIQRTPIHNLTLFEEHIGHIHNWNCRSFGLDAFGWMINPDELIEKLSILAHQRSYTQPKNIYVIIATGHTVPEHIPFHETPGKPYQTLQKNTNLTQSQHDIHLHWQTQQMTAHLPSLVSSNSIAITTTHTNHPSQPTYHAYYRETSKSNHLLMGDSLLSIPPTLASGYNSCLQLIQLYCSHSITWNQFRSISQRHAKKQFTFSQRYHQIIVQKWMRGPMLASYKNKFIMNLIIQEVLNGIH